MFEYLTKSPLSANNSQFRVMLVTFPVLCTQPDARAVTEREEIAVKHLWHV